MNPSPLRKDFCMRLPPFMIDGTAKKWPGFLLSGTHLADYPILWTKDNMANGMFNVHPYYTGERYFGKSNLLLRPPNTFMYTDNDLGSESPDIQNKFDIAAIQSTIDGLKKPFDQKGIFAARVFNLRLKRDEFFSRLEWGIDAGLLERKDQGLLDDPTLAAVADPSTWVGGSLLVYLILDNSLTNGKYCTEIDPAVVTWQAGLETIEVYGYPVGVATGDRPLRATLTLDRTLQDDHSFRQFVPNTALIESDMQDVQAALPNFGKIRWLVWYKQEAPQEISQGWVNLVFVPPGTPGHSQPWVIVDEPDPIPTFAQAILFPPIDGGQKGYTKDLGSTQSYLDQRAAIVRDAVQQAAGTHARYADAAFDLEAELVDFFELTQ